MCKHKNGLFLFYANSLPGRRFVMSGSVSPLPWTGNKGCIYTTIDAFMPPHRTYVEACMGSAEVFLRKKPVEKEIINDYNGDLVRFFRVLQRNENLERLIGRLFLSFNSEQIFRANKALLAEVPNILDDLTETSVIIENTQWNDFDLAVAFYENQVFSFSSTGKNFAITKKDMTKRFGRLIAACARLRNATIMHRDYKDCISYSAGEDAFILLDPPYKGTEDYYQKSSFGSDEHAKLFGFMNEVHVEYPPEADIVRWIFQAYLRGMSTAEIAKDLTDRGIPTKNGKEKWKSSKISYMLSNERYIGDCCYQKTYRGTTVPFKQSKNHGEEDMYYATGTHAPIVEKDLFEKVQVLLKKRKEQFTKATTQNIYPLTSRIRCSECGSFYRRKVRSGGIKWVCARHEEDFKACNSNYYSEERIYDGFLSMVNKLRFGQENILGQVIAKLEYAAQQYKRNNKTAMQISQKIAEINATILKLNELRSKG